jgi:cytochrome P460
MAHAFILTCRALTVQERVSSAVPALEASTGIAQCTPGHFPRDSRASAAHCCGMATTTLARAHRWLAIAGVSVLTGFAAPRFVDAVPYPAGYRQWTHIKSMVVLPSSSAFATGGGMHHVYANAAAISGLTSGRFPDGSVFVFDLLKATENAGVIASGERERLDVMVKDSKRYAATRGWGFERFMGNDTTPSLTEEHRKLCVSCHDQRAEQDRVFSTFAR